jgi:hypothetical protein
MKEKGIGFLRLDGNEAKNDFNKLSRAIGSWKDVNSYPPLPLPGGDFEEIHYYN